MRHLPVLLSLVFIVSIFTSLIKNYIFDYLAVIQYNLSAQVGNNFFIMCGKNERSIELFIQRFHSLDYVM